MPRAVHRDHCKRLPRNAARKESAECSAFANRRPHQLFDIGLRMPPAAPSMYRGLCRSGPCRPLRSRDGEGRSGGKWRSGPMRPSFPQAQNLRCQLSVMGNQVR